MNLRVYQANDHDVAGSDAYPSCRTPSGAPQEFGKWYVMDLGDRGRVVSEAFETQAAALAALLATDTGKTP